MRESLIICLLLCASPAAAADISGRARVIDGDTLQIGQTRIRLHGIDAPEASQTCLDKGGVSAACGLAATRAMQVLIGNNTVSCAPRDTDRYGRTVAKCTAAGRDLGQDMVAAGLATAYRQYSMDYVPFEQAARAEGLGVWGVAMQNPAEYRAAQSGQGAAPDGCVIKGNISGSGMIYHMPGQEHYGATQINVAKGERWFCTQSEARAAGWRAARR
ncbi:thermonuclease family protein [Loktanella salsilacus]|uniref:thermonuclease family protein n=1 Tax=Loktanella salsilacus TaxID=195913 RepID=UPI003735A4D6